MTNCRTRSWILSTLRVLKHLFRTPQTITNVLSVRKLLKFSETSIEPYRAYHFARHENHVLQQISKIKSLTLVIGIFYELTLKLATNQ
jgi:hypothetical protein